LSRPVHTNLYGASNLDSLRDGLGDSGLTPTFLRNMQELEAARAIKREEMASRAGVLLDEYRIEKHRLLGEARLASASQLFQSRRQQLRKMADSADADLRRIADFQRETRRELAGVISPADARSLTTLREAVTAELAKLAKPAQVCTAVALDEKDVPEDIRAPKHNPPFKINPPYPWSETYFYHQLTTGYSTVTNWWLNAGLGKVGARMTYYNDNPFQGDDY